MRVYVCGAETLSRPAFNAGREARAENTTRFHQVFDFLATELRALFDAGQLTALAYDPGTSLAIMLAGFGGGSVIPVSRVPGSQVRTTTVVPANAISVFGAELIFALGPGLAPNPLKLATIEALRQQARLAGVLWRDARNITADTVPIAPFVRRV